MKRWTIYCHTHVESGRRYVGLTSKTMLARWNDHVCKAKSSKGGRWHFPNAIRKYGKGAFSHEVLEICHDLEVANLAEECWVELFDTRNPEKGFNLAKGGQHIPHPIRRNPWSRPEYRAKCSEASKKKWDDPDFRHRCSTAKVGVKLSPEHCAGIAVARMGKDHAPEVRARINESVRRRVKDPDVRTKLSESSTEKWRNPEFRSNVGPEISRGVKERWQDPEYRAKFARHTDTHKICKVHGPILLEDCHRRFRRGTVRYECSECNRIRNRKAHRERELRATG